MAIVNNLPAGSTPFSNQIWKDENDRIWTGDEFASQYYRFLDETDVPYIYLSDFGAIGDGVADDTQSFLDAIAYATTHPYRRYIIGELGKSYKVSQQLVLTIDLTLDLMYSEIIFRGAPIISVTGYNVTLKNILFNLGAGQYGISYGNSSQKNIEIGCWTTRGYAWLVEPNINNATGYSNRSFSSETIKKGNPVVKNKIYELDANFNSGQVDSIVIAGFPARCYVNSISISDVNGSPDFSVDFFYWGVYRGRESEDFIIKDVDYAVIGSNDLIVCRIQNFKANATVFKFEAVISEPQFKTQNKVWEFTSKRDLIRPHPDTVPPNTAVNINTIRSVEYRYLVSGALNVKGAAPSRVDDRAYSRNRVIIPTGTGTQDTSMSELKFYFDYPASRAVMDRPTRFRMEIYKVPKQTTVSVKNGWYSQNPDLYPSYLKSVPHPTFDITIPSTASTASPFIIEILLDHKAYDTASALEGANSFNFFYLTLFSSGFGYTPLLWGEEYWFSAYFVKDQIEL